jgi:hypothetical protein
MDQRSLNIVLKLQNEASKELEKFSKDAEKTSVNLKKVAAIGVAAFATVTAAIGKTVMAYAESEKQLVRVDQTIRNSVAKNGGEFDKLTAKARDFGTQLQKITGIADEAGAEGFAKMLLIAGGDMVEAQRLANLAADLAISKQIDYMTAVRTISTVQAGNVRVLKEYGIVLDENATKEQANAALLEAVGGQAEAYGKTVAGQTDILKQSFGDLQEDIGKMFVPAVQKALDATQGLVDKLQAVAQNIPEIRERIGAFFQQLDEKTGTITLLKEALANVTFMYNERLKPALVELLIALEPFKPILDYMVQVFGTLLVAAINGLIVGIEVLVVMFTEVLTWAAKVGTFFAGVLKKQFEDFGDTVLAITNFVEKLVGWYKKAIDYADQLGSRVGGSIVSKFLPGRATGGPVTGNAAYMVGEQGPEVFVPRVSGTIVPNGALAYAGAGLTVNVYGDVTGQELVEKVSRAIADNIKRRQRLA